MALIQSLVEQKDAAIDNNWPFTGMLIKKLPDGEWTWVVAEGFEAILSAELWFDRQKGLCRVYDSKGHLRFAK